MNKFIIIIVILSSIFSSVSASDYLGLFIRPDRLSKFKFVRNYIPVTNYLNSSSSKQSLSADNVKIANNDISLLSKTINNQELILKLNSFFGNNIKIYIINLSGNFIYFLDYKNYSVGNEIPISLTNISKGFYIINIIGENHRHCETFIY